MRDIKPRTAITCMMLLYLILSNSMISAQSVEKCNSFKTKNVTVIIDRDIDEKGGSVIKLMLVNNRLSPIYFDTSKFEIFVQDSQFAATKKGVYGSPFYNTEPINLTKLPPFSRYVLVIRLKNVHFQEVLSGNLHFVTRNEIKKYNNDRNQNKGDVKKEEYYADLLDMFSTTVYFDRVSSKQIWKVDYSLNSEE